MSAGTYRKIEDLPATLAVFPLPGAVLFPHWHLPLNIFEPRYLNMIDDAMAGNRLIGMVQSVGGSREHPDLAEIGCAGRITSYSETDDGRYLINLSGIARFTIAEELKTQTPYRQVRADWSAFIGDLCAPDTTGLPEKETLITALNAYVAANQFETDWGAVEQADIETLVNALSAGCPFSVMEKQALLEAENLKARAETLITLLRIDVSGTEDGTLQ